MIAVVSRVASRFQFAGRWSLAAALALAASSAPVSARPLGPEVLSKLAADTLKAAILKDRKETEDSLRLSQTSYLATTMRKDFGDKATLILGTSNRCDLQFNDAAIADKELRVTVIGDSFRVTTLHNGSAFTYKGQSLKDATLPPTYIGMSRYLLRLSHQRYPAIIVFDPKSPRYALYHGIKYFPVDFKYRFRLPFIPNPKPDTTIILSTRGNQRRAIRAGWFEFKVGGVACKLEANRLLEPGVGETSISLFFRDATTGKQSYDVGRYVEPERQPDGTYIVDFNQCYSPACAYSDHYNCPIPPKENVLKVAIRAGEMDSHYHEKAK
jgi:uncharacterized protein (DUF1684 family)